MKLIRNIFVPLVAILAAGYWLTTWNHGNAPTETPAQASVDLAKQEADKICMASIRDQAKYENSLHFVGHSDELDPVKAAPGGGYFVGWNITAKNGLGIVTPYKAECVVVKGKLASISINPR